MKTVVVEGWRGSCHSYALVNQQQLLHLSNEPRLSVFHRDVQFFRDDWARVDSGLPLTAKLRLAALPTPPAELQPDVTYRISYPFRVHGGTGRIMVFATNELDRTLENDCVGADGHRATADRVIEIITPSSWSRRAFLAAGYVPERVHCVPHGVDPAFAMPVDAAERRRLRTQLRVPEDGFAFLHIGAMSWNKGVGPLIAAFAVHRRSYPRSILILKGGDALYGNVLQVACEEAGRLRPEARDPEVAKNLRYIRVNLPLHGLASLYRAADAYISCYRAEGFNLPVLEAMASHLPVIVTRGGSTDDFCPDDSCLKVEADLVDGPVGMHLEPRIESIVDSMAQTVEDAGARDGRATRAHDHVLPRYSWARVTEQLADLFCR